MNEKAHVASGTKENARLAPILIIGFISLNNVAVSCVFFEGDVMLLLPAMTEMALYAQFFSLV